MLTCIPAVIFENLQGQTCLELRALEATIITSAGWTRMQRWSNLTMDCTMRLKNLFKGSQHQVGLVQRKELLQVWLVFLGHCLYACIHPPVQETVHGPGFLWDAPRVRLGEGLHWWRGEYHQILSLGVQWFKRLDFIWVQITTIQLPYS